MPIIKERFIKRIKIGGVAMKKMEMVLLSLLLIAVFGSTGKVTGKNTNEEVMCIPMGNILLEPPELVKAKKSPVDFPHSRHFFYDCKTCHHQWEGDTQIQNCTTSGCHDLEKSPTRLGKGKSNRELNLKYYKTAYHNLCIGCHKKMKMKNKQLEKSQTALKTKLPATGPTGCIKCHPKQ